MRTSCLVVQEWGWVQEMYGFTIACFNAGIGKIDLYPKMMAQPPWDTELDPYYILHFTYGNDYSLNGTFTPGIFGEWRFDKRSYAALPPPRNLGQPPVNMKNDLVSESFGSLPSIFFFSPVPLWAFGYPFVGARVCACVCARSHACVRVCGRARASVRP